MATSDFLLFLHNCSVAETIDPACPALAPPPGELPLDPNASTLLTTALGVLVTCCILIVVGMIVRVFTRAYIVRTVFALEDGETVLAPFESKQMTNADAALMILATVRFQS